MEIPSPFSGVIGEVAVSVGDHVSEGALLARINISDAKPDAESIAASRDAVDPEKPNPVTV
jgi:pyruvate dehydrogenase E2 component (dihydrolipoamide acetyltransferase)